MGTGGETFEFSNFFFCKISPPFPSPHCPLEDLALFLQKGPSYFTLCLFFLCPEMATACTYCHEMEKDIYRRKALPSRPSYPPTLLQSDFNFVNCYEGSLIAKRGGCQNPTVTRFLLSHFTAILCLTLDMQA